jgi:hypothetical protein
MKAVKPPRDYIVIRKRKSTRSGTLLSQGIVVVSVVAAAILFLTATAFLLRPFERSKGTGAKDEAASLLPLSIQEYALKFPKQFDRLVYPYSVVPGGVANAAEARNAVLTDSVVRAHYRHLDLGNLRSAVLAEDRMAYVSYRKGDRVFWTARKIRLFKGETLLTDGTSMVRGRCGNLVSDSPRDMASLKEPSEKVLNTPALPADAVALLQPPEGVGPPATSTPGESTNPGDPQPAVTPNTVITSVSGQPENAFPMAFTPYSGYGMPAGTSSISPPGTDATTSGVGTISPVTQPLDTNQTGPGTSPANPKPPQPPTGTTSPSGPELALLPSVAPPRTFPGSPSTMPPFAGPPVTGRPSPDLAPPPGPGQLPTLPDPGSTPSGPWPVEPAAPSSVPEPSTWLLVGAGMLGLLLLVHSNRRRIDAPGRPE